MDVIRGYKAFHNMQGRNGTSYEVGETYTTDEPIEYQKSGYHFCERIEDVLRYYDGFRDDINICLVEGSGVIDTYNDEYNEYFDMHSVSRLTILKELTRDEIINTVIKENIYSIKRFIAGFKLTEKEINEISDEFKEEIIRDYIDYYQNDDREAFSRKRR